MTSLYSHKEGSPPPLPSRRQQAPPKPPKLPQRRYQNDEEEAPPLPRRSQSPFEVNLVTPVIRKREPPIKPKASKPTLNAEKRPQYGANDTKVVNDDRKLKTNESDAETTKKTFNNTSFGTKPATKYKSFLDLEQQIKTGQRIGESNEKIPKPTAPKKPAKIAHTPLEEQKPEKATKEPANGPLKGPGFIAKSFTKTTSPARAFETEKPIDSENFRGSEPPESKEPPKEPVKGPGFIAMSFTKESLPHKPRPHVGPKPDIKESSTSQPSETTEQKPPKPKPRIGAKPPLKTSEAPTIEKGPGFIVMPFTKVAAPSNQERPLKPQPLTSKSQPLAPKTPPKPSKPASPAALKTRSISIGALAPTNTEAIGALSRLKPTKPVHNSSKHITLNENKSSDSVNSKSSLSFNDHLSSLLKTNTLPSLSAAEKPQPPQRSTTLPDITGPAKITHANKKRAKGPKRRLPGKSSSNTSKGSISSLSSTPTLLQKAPLATLKKTSPVVKKTPPPVNKASKPKVASKPDPIVVNN
ncbi:hypothetical protein QFC19_008527 [Naganishia cerealis]|uniref:Uncharacterized protein n=1 Tax=Naganishia cerealis TaxID=610337 RepID=A0ACC2V338_9TREE|nr:hypothetical protein QFC19_008527 [Naganishia cerealis]